jgi:hypothetical protein
VTLGYLLEGSSVEKVDSIEGETSIAWTDLNDFDKSCVTAPAPVNISFV